MVRLSAPLEWGHSLTWGLTCLSRLREDTRIRVYADVYPSILTVLCLPFHEAVLNSLSLGLSQVGSKKYI